MTMMEMLPLGTTPETVESNLVEMEAWCAQIEQSRKDEELRVKSLTPQQRRTERESIPLSFGFKACPICGALPCFWMSLSLGYGIDGVFIFTFDETKNSELEALFNKCPEHGPSTRKQGEQRFWNSRFKTMEEMVDDWNNSLPTQLK